ncbi:PA3496 family putative envelope integrity protein [Microbulbifer thermotolerans]|uniref:PA3496 family putative envelope integrity protein n=1 Tax=Microbulbifer thermotolerans TaxID=252514 RepID=UPI0022493DC1|nr:hypothetical protein [Microbulbifer thermotolerans]MCX2831713.1 hypothetical protein [Microbulbifer thermotolerans]
MLANLQRHNKKTPQVFLLSQIEIVEFRMSGNVSGNDYDFDYDDLPQIANEVLRQATSKPPRDARRMVEDKLEEMRLRRELMDYDFDL